MLRQEAPDVMGVQEAMQDQLYYIDTECPRYARVGEDRDGGAEGGETMAVFYLATGSNCWTAAPSGSARLPTTCRADGMPPATAR